MAKKCKANGCSDPATVERILRGGGERLHFCAAHNPPNNGQVVLDDGRTIVSRNGHLSVKSHATVASFAPRARSIWHL